MSTATRVSVSSIGSSTSAKSGNPGHVAQSLVNGLTQSYARILDGMVLVDMQIALRPDIDIDQRMAGELFQHMVEKADAGRDFGGAGAIEIDANVNPGFLGLA